MGLVGKVAKLSLIGIVGLYISHKFEPIKEPFFEKVDGVDPVAIYQKAEQSVEDRYKQLISQVEAVSDGLENKVREVKE